MPTFRVASDNRAREGWQCCRPIRGAAVSPSRADTVPIGTVISVTGSQATIKLAALPPSEEARITVGKFAAIRSGPVTVIGVVTRLAERPGESADEPAISIAELDLLGELKGEAGARFFQRGVTEYPALGDESDLLSGDDLRLIYDLSGAGVIVVGQLQQDAAAARLHQGQRDARQAFRLLRHDRRRQVDRRRAAPAKDPRGAAGPPHLPRRSAQRIRPLLRRLRAGAQPEEPEAALLALQFRGDGRRLLRRPAGRRGGGRDSLRSDPAGEDALRRRPRLRAHVAPQEPGGDRLHPGHARPLPPCRSRRAHRRAHGQAREPLGRRQICPPDHPHRARPQGPALRLHVRQRQCRRRRHRRGAGAALPPAARGQADDGDAARRLPGRGDRFGGLGARPDGLRLRPLERRRRADALRLRGGPPLRPGRPHARLRPDPEGASAASPRRAANTASTSASSPSARPSSTPPSSRR